MFPIMMQPPPIVMNPRVPARIQAAMDFVSLFRQTRTVGGEYSEQVIANSQAEESAYGAAMQALRLYFNGEIEPDTGGYGPLDDDTAASGAAKPPPSPKGTGGETSPNRRAGDQADDCCCPLCVARGELEKQHRPIDQARMDG